MQRHLKKLSGMDSDDHANGYSIMKYWHPDARKRPEEVSHVDTEEEAQEICGRPESSYKEGDTSTWYFLGYTRAGNRSKHVTLW